MEEQSEIVRSKKEFAFASSTILSQVGRGIIVGLIVGIIEGEVTLIEIPVSDKIAGKQVHELNLPHNVLITTQVHNGKSQTVNGSTRMYLGDMIHLVIPKSEIGKVKDLLL